MEIISKLIAEITGLIQIAKTGDRPAESETSNAIYKANLLARAKEIGLLVSGCSEIAKKLTETEKDAVGLEFSERLFEVL